MQISGREFTTALLDIDGTLIDSNHAHAKAWGQALHEHGIPVETNRIRPLIGKGGDKLLCEVARLEEDSPTGQHIKKRKKEIFEQVLPALQPTPGARALLEYLRANKVSLQSLTPDAAVTGDRGQVEWSVRAPQGTRITVSARHDRAGRVRAEVLLLG